MPVRSHQIEEPGGARVFVFTCEDCGGAAHFSEDANLRAALQEGNVKLAGRWFCGWRDGAPACVAETQGSLL